MNENRTNCLNLSLEEEVFFSPKEAVSELVSISLEPSVNIERTSQYVILRGTLNLMGEYIAVNGNNSNLEQDPFDSIRSYAEVTVREEDDVKSFKYTFPVDVTIPAARVRPDVALSIDVGALDYKILEEGNIHFFAELYVNGVEEEEVFRASVEQEEEKLLGEATASEEKADSDNFKGEDLPKESDISEEDISFTSEEEYANLRTENKDFDANLASAEQQSEEELEANDYNYPLDDLFNVAELEEVSIHNSQIPSYNAVSELNRQQEQNINSAPLDFSEIYLSDEQKLQVEKDDDFGKRESVASYEEGEKTHHNFTDVVSLVNIENKNVSENNNKVRFSDLYIASGEKNNFDKYENIASCEETQKPSNNFADVVSLVNNESKNGLENNNKIRFSDLYIASEEKNNVAKGENISSCEETQKPSNNVIDTASLVNIENNSKVSFSALYNGTEKSDDEISSANKVNIGNERNNATINHEETNEQVDTEADANCSVTNNVSASVPDLETPEKTNELAAKASDNEISEINQDIEVIAENIETTVNPLASWEDDILDLEADAEYYHQEEFHIEVHKEVDPFSTYQKKEYGPSPRVEDEANSSEDKRELESNSIWSEIFSGGNEEKAALRLYIVQAGDTLQSLAEKYKVSMHKLLHLNNIREDENLEPGKLLYISR